MKKNRFKFLSSMVLLCMVSFLCACSENSSNKKINNYVKNLKKEISTKKTPTNIKMLDITPPAPVKYTSTPSREPFGTTEISTAKKVETTTPTNPLLVYPLSMLRFVGTLFFKRKSFAYVLTPDNKIHQVKIGDLIGDHKGKVTHINYDQMEVTEYYFEAGKQPFHHKIVLKLKDVHR